jgi:hypothetical protein
MDYNKLDALECLIRAVIAVDVAMELPDTRNGLYAKEVAADNLSRARGVMRDAMREKGWDV